MYTAEKIARAYNYGIEIGSSARTRNVRTLARNTCISMRVLSGTYEVLRFPDGSVLVLPWASVGLLEASWLPPSMHPAAEAPISD